jgi:hypothetical protein
MRKHLWTVLGVLVILSMVAAQCGSPPPATEAPTKAAEVTEAPKPTDTPVPPTDTPVPEPTDTPVPEPTDTPTPEPTATVEEEEEVEFGTYEHPSGAFSLALPVDAEYVEGENYAFFGYGESFVIALYADAQAELTRENLANIADKQLNIFLLEAGMVDGYEILDVEPVVVNNGFVVFFNYSSAEYGDGEGGFFIAQADQIVYSMILLTPDYEDVEDTWLTIVDSFTFNPEAVKAAAPTAEPTVPAPTKAPAPTPTEVPAPPPTEEAPAPPSGVPAECVPQAGKGVLMLVQYAGGECTFDIAGQTKKVPGTDTVPEGGIGCFQLDPGHHTWSANMADGRIASGELDIEAGKIFRLSLH